MKKYIVPEIHCIDLRTEEGLATNVECKIGECHDENTGEPIYLSAGTSS
jgi:hypothetical protein